MSAARAISLVNSWETIRYELLNTRICDLGLQIESSLVEPYVARLHREVESKKLDFLPKLYLTDGWGCPDQVPVIGIPFYLTDKHLMRLEEEQTGEIEDEQMLMMLLRHEAGHAINYAFRLWEYDGWAEHFGNFDKPYRDTFRPDKLSKEFVRHISHHRYGRTYAQKHPDEDFAETFAVWLTPRSGWKHKYRYWPALKKLKFVDELMKQIREVEPLRTDGGLLQPIEELTITLAQHYGQRAERYRAAAQGYVDDKLHEVFPEIKSRNLRPVSELLKIYQRDLLERITRWSGLDEEEASVILSKLQDRAVALGMMYRRKDLQQKLLDLTALATSLAIDFAYTGRLTG